MPNPYGGEYGEEALAVVIDGWVFIGSHAGGDSGHEYTIPPARALVIG